GEGRIDLGKLIADGMAGGGAGCARGRIYDDLERVRCELGFEVLEGGGAVGFGPFDVEPAQALEYAAHLRRVDVGVPAFARVEIGGVQEGIAGRDYVERDGIPELAVFIGEPDEGDSRAGFG